MLGKRYPFDPPLTLAGTKQAKAVGKASNPGASKDPLR